MDFSLSPSKKSRTPLRRSSWTVTVATTTMAMMTTMGVVTQARVHHLFVGNLYPPARLYALAFDDEAPYRLEVTANMTADAAHSWIAFDANKTNVYGASLNKSAIASYEVVVAVSNAGAANGDDHATAAETKNVTLELRNSVAASGACFNRTSAYVLPHPRYPRVFSASWPGPDACAMSLSTTPPPPADGSGGAGGVLEEVVQSWRYGNTSGIHGLALDPSDGGMTIYSADLNGDALWAHALAPDGTGRVVGWRGSYDLPDDQKGSHPRHLVVHPSGKVLYVVMEAANTVVAYAIDPTLRLVTEELSRHSLLPPGADPAAYWSAEVMLSQPQGKYLWATARAWTGRRNDTTQPPFAPHPGFISAFRLDEESGAITEQLFRVPTTTLDGIANAISPAPWSEDWAAMTDIGTGYVQMWRMERTEGEGGVVATTARDVARVDIPDGGCCANVIWYD